MLLYVIFLNVELNGQTEAINIKGKVIDPSGNVLPGTAVIVKGTSLGTTTNDDGDYQLSNVPKGSVLEFILVSYVTQEIKVAGDKTVINAILIEDTQSLDEVTVVAFGKQKKESVIASVESVRMSDLKQVSSNLTGALAGRIPGIISYQTTGEPGADNAQFFVRGVTTFGYKKDPLILIDGFEATATDLARLQPDDVESFSILKDAAATVLYGARGANGIIVIVTKSGQLGDTKVDARINVHVATPTMTNEYVDGVTYMKMYNEAQISRSPALGAFYSEQKIQATAQGQNPMIYPNVDWYGELFKKVTVNKNANVRVSGGGQVATFHISGGYENENGLLKVDNRNNFNNNININRFDIRSNVIFKLTSTTTLDTRISGRFERYTGPNVSAGDLFDMVMNANPVDFPKVYEPDADHMAVDHILFGGAYIPSVGRIKENPYAEMVKGYTDKDNNTMTAMATLMQDLKFITKGLNFQAKASINTSSEYGATRAYVPYQYDVESYNMITGEYKLFNLNPLNADSYLGDLSINDRVVNTHYYFEARLNWDRKFGKHSVGLMTVGTVEEYVIGDGAVEIYESLPERNMGNSGRLTYDYDTRYFLELAYGYNGSEKFTGEKRYGFFPSIAGGWLVSNESFWAPLKNTVSTLKLKASYGSVGNDAIADREGRFFYLSQISMGGAGYRWGSTFMNSYNGYIISRYANPDITWESSVKYNLGLEVGMFNEALKFQVDIFKDQRSSIYLERSNFPATTGLEATISGNVGKVESKGIDASLDYQYSFRKDLWVTGRANVTYATNKYVELDEKDYKDEYLKRRGTNTSQWYGLIAERLFVDQNEINNSPRQDFGAYMAGDIKYKDINGDGVVDKNDRVPLGYPTVPEIQYGFGLSAGYKKFDFSFFFQGNARVSFFIDPTQSGIAPLVERRNALAIVASDYWTETKPNVHAFWPRLSTSPVNNNSPYWEQESLENDPTSSWWLRDGSFLRLKTVELGYALPGIEKIGVKSSRLYLSAENVFVLSAFKLWDPEMGRNGLEYPPNRRFNVGIQLSF
jgi:TonB-linked SusC/RagA family outer membrane protein